MAIKWLGKGLVWILVPLLAFNLYVGAKLYSENETVRTSRDKAFSSIARFTKVLHQVRETYVDEEKTDFDELINSALDGMLQNLDPHSQFLDVAMYDDMKDDTAGRFGGLGVVISVKDSILTIVAPMEDTPGIRAGLLSGDKIIEIDEESTKGMSLPEAVKLLRGVAGTSVKIKVLRPKTASVIDVEIIREMIVTPSIKDAHIIEDGIGYLRMTQFNSPTAEALQESLNELLDQGMNSLIIDLRNNPGGLLSAAIEVSQKFLKRGQLIVKTKGRNDYYEHVYESRGRKHYLDFPIAILVNGGSASASEIVAGALQDHKRAILVGERTFGKGSVQSVQPLEEGYAMRLTTAKYYTPSERVIHENGIEPDISVPMSSEDWVKIMEKRAKASRALKAEDEGIDVPDEEVEEEVRDVQLERAMDVIKGIKIFQSQNVAERTVASNTL